MDQTTWLGLELRVAERRGTYKQAFTFCHALAQSGRWEDVWGFCERYLARLDAKWRIDRSPSWPEEARLLANVARLLQPLSALPAICQRTAGGFTTSYARTSLERQGPNPLPLYLRALMYWAPDTWSEWMRMVDWSDSTRAMGTLARYGICADGSTQVRFDAFCPALPEIPNRHQYEAQLEQQGGNARLPLVNAEQSWRQALLS